MKKGLTISLLLFLSACQPIEPVIEPMIEPMTTIQPELFLNHLDRDTMPLATHFEDIGVCYQIFVISFADSNNDGLGDLNGITENLDYLSDLNVQCLWLTPIHPSNSYHKYDVLDFYDIDPDFGSLADFDRLIEEAAKRDIVVLMDLVLNHTSNRHPWFRERPEYYRFISENHPEYGSVNWHAYNGLEYYAYFGNHMPELNLDHPDVREETFQIARFWLERGVGGFRLDAVRHFFDTSEYPIRTNTLLQNIIYLKEFNELVKSINPNAIVIAEVMSSAGAVARYLPGVDSAFNFDLSDAIISTVSSNSDSVSNDVVGTYLRIQELYQAQNTPYQDSLFLTNHDQDRVISLLNNNEAKAKLAATIVFTLPGTSWIYYGEELGMRGVRSAATNTDAERRQPMPWRSAAQVYTVDGYVLEFANQLLAPGNQMFQHYQAITALKADPVIRLGQVGRVNKTLRHFLTYTISYQGTNYLVVHNLSNKEQPLLVDVEVTILHDINANIEEPSKMIMQPYSSVIFEVSTIQIDLLVE